jgi:hypothetical protein
VAGTVGHAIQVAGRIGHCEVHRRQRDPVLHREQREHALERSRRAEQVTVHRLRRTDRDRVRARAEHRLDRGGLDRVVGLRAGAVRIDCVDRGRFEAGRCQRGLQRGGLPFDARPRDVGRIGREAVADHLAER